MEGAFVADFLSGDADRFTTGDTLLIDGQRSTVASLQPGPNGSAILRVDAVRSVEAAEALRGAAIETDAADLPVLDHDEFYHYQLIDSLVYSVDGEYLGVIREILETGANDVFLIRADAPAAAELLVPAVKEVVRAVDVEKGVIIVDLPEGLR